MIIGIGGISQSGKSYLANELSRRFNNAKIFSLDDFTRPQHQLPKIKDRFDWEVPQAYAFDSLLTEIRRAQKEYDHIIVEGILVFYCASINNIFNRRIMLTIDQAEFLVRRRKETRWGQEPEWFLYHVWECYEKYGKSVQPEALWVNNHEFDHLNEILAYLS